MKKRDDGKKKERFIRILVVDDHPMMRQGLIQLITGEPDLEVCGESETASEALAAAQNLKPDLLIADITLPGKNGLELIKDLRIVLPDLPILVLSMHDETLYAERVLRAGGRGYIMKQEGGKKIVEGIRRVLSGKMFFSEAISAQVMESLAAGTHGLGSRVGLLTDRELEVFQLIGEGKSTRDIAEGLCVSSKTIEVHRLNIKQKLEMKTAAELIRFAVRWVESTSGA